MGRLGSRPQVTGRLGSRVWVSASFQILPLTAGETVLGGEENCPGGGMSRGNMSRRGKSPTLILLLLMLIRLSTTRTCRVVARQAQQRNNAGGRERPQR